VGPSLSETEQSAISGNPVPVPSLGHVWRRRQSRARGREWKGYAHGRKPNTRGPSTHFAAGTAVAQGCRYMLGGGTFFSWPLGPWLSTETPSRVFRILSAAAAHDTTHYTHASTQPCTDDQP